MDPRERHLGFFRNFLLMASFLGIGIGILWGRNPNRITLPGFGPLLLAVTVLVMTGRVSIQLRSPSEIFFGLTENSTAADVNFARVARARRTRGAVRPASRSRSADSSGRCRCCRAYTRDIAGSMAGIAAFTVLSGLGTGPSRGFSSSACSSWGASPRHSPTSLVMLARRKPLLTAGALVVLLIPTVYEVGVGNLNSMVLLGLILAWRWATRGPQPAAGVVTAILTVVKLTPAALGWWLIVTKNWRAVAAAIVTGVIALGISVLGAGLDTHLEYLRILRDPGSMSPSALSLAGMAVYVGVPAQVANLLPTLAIVVGLVAIFLLRDRLAWSFGVTVLVMIYGSPAVSINWYVLLYALIAPLAWPLRAEVAAPADPAPEIGISRADKLAQSVWAGTHQAGTGTG